MSQQQKSKLAQAIDEVVSALDRFLGIVARLLLMVIAPGLLVLLTSSVLAKLGFDQRLIPVVEWQWLAGSFACLWFFKGGRI